MPQTRQHTLSYRAAVIFDDGDSKTCPLETEQDANDWINRQIYKYGSYIVAIDIYPNT